jgi:polar amino acid transport system permease protein
MSGVLADYGALLLRAAGITLWISWLGLLLGGLLGAAVGLARTSRLRVLRILALLYTELFRSIPVLILMFFCYFGLPLLVGLDLSPFAAATAALMFTASALMAEVVRAGIDSVARGQWEAAFSSGMRYRQVMWHIVGPQAVRVMLPPSVGVYIATLKESSLASIIGYVELTKTALLIRETTGESLEVLATIALLYFVINYGISLAGGALERKFAIAHY